MKGGVANSTPTIDCWKLSSKVLEDGFDAFLTICPVWSVGGFLAICPIWSVGGFPRHMSYMICWWVPRHMSYMICWWVPRHMSYMICWWVSPPYVLYDLLMGSSPYVLYDLLVGVLTICPIWLKDYNVLGSELVLNSILPWGEKGIATRRWEFVVSAEVDLMPTVASTSPLTSCSSNTQCSAGWRTSSRVVERHPQDLRWKSNPTFPTEDTRPVEEQRQAGRWKTKLTALLRHCWSQRPQACEIPRNFIFFKCGYNHIIASLHSCDSFPTTSHLVSEAFIMFN